MHMNVVVIGAGPGGLAAAGALRARDVAVTVVDRQPHVGHTWRHHYDRLHLHTPRELSHLPGYPIPRRFGRWVSRADVVRYLEEYAAHHRLDLRLGTGVRGLERQGERWAARLEDGSALAADHVIIATGYNNTPVPPSWPGAGGFPGEIAHANGYRNGRAYAGRDVLVVGPGNTGAEIATDLAEHGARTVWLAVRNPPHILPRARLGWPTQATGIVVRRLPPRLVDRVGAVLARVESPDLTAYGMPRATSGLYSQVLDGRIPVQDVGIVQAIKERRVLPVPAMEAFEGAEVVLADGRRLCPDTVLVATGYRAGLESLVGDLGVLNERGLPVVQGAQTPPGQPGLWFTGFTNPISGMFRELRIDAERIAKAIAAGRR